MNVSLRGEDSIVLARSINSVKVSLEPVSKITFVKNEVDYSMRHGDGGQSFRLKGSNPSFMLSKYHKLWLQYSGKQEIIVSSARWFEGGCGLKSSKCFLPSVKNACFPSSSYFSQNQADGHLENSLSQRQLHLCLSRKAEMTTLVFNGIFRQWEDYLKVQNNKRLSSACDLKGLPFSKQGESVAAMSMKFLWSDVLIMILCVEVWTQLNLLSSPPQLPLVPSVKKFEMPNQHLMILC